jgi:hypothetical protein
MAKSRQVAEAVLRGDTKHAQKEWKAFAKTADVADDRVGRVGQTLGKVESSLGKLGIAGAAAFVAFEGARRAAQLVQELSEESLTAQNIMANMAFSIGKAEQATGSLISKLDLQRAANNAASLGVAKSADEFAKLAKVAQILGARVGLSATKSLEDLTVALGRSSPMILDNLGIQLRLTDAYEGYARTLGLTVAELTDAQKKQAFQNEALRKAEEITKDASIATDGLAVSLQQAVIETKNLRNAALGAAPVVKNLAQIIKEMGEEERRLIKGSRYGGAARIGAEMEELEEAVRDAGGELKSLGEAQRILRRIESDELAEMAEARRDGTAAREEDQRVAAEANAEQISDNKEFIEFFEQELAFARARKESASEVNSLEQQLLELKATNLELEGKIGKAEAARFKLRIKVAEAESIRPRGRRGGRKKDFFAQFKPDPFQEAGAGGAFQEELLAEDQTKIQEKLLAINQRHHVANLEAQELRERRVLAMRQEIDLMAAQGAATSDVLSAQAELAMFEGDEHQAKLFRIAEHRAAVEESAEAQVQAIRITLEAQKMSAAITSQTLDFVVAAQGIFGEKNLKLVEAVESGKMFIMAGVETAEAVASYASWNIPAGILHTAAAATATAMGVSIITGSKRRSGAVGDARGGAGGRDVGGITPATGGGGVPQGRGPDQVPVSPTGETSGRSLPQGGGQGAGGITVINNGTMFGANPDQLASAISKTQGQGIRKTGKQIN